MSEKLSPIKPHEKEHREESPPISGQDTSEELSDKEDNGAKKLIMKPGKKIPTPTRVMEEIVNLKRRKFKRLAAASQKNNETVKYKSADITKITERRNLRRKN